MRSAKIAILLNTLSPGGAEKQALLLAKLLKAKNHNVSIIVIRPELIDPDFLNRVLSTDAEIIKLNGGFFKKAINLFKLLRDKKIEVLLNYLLLPNFFGGIIGRLAGIRLIVGGIRNAQLAPKKETLERVIHNHLSHLTVFNNHCGKEDLTDKGFSTSKAEVIHNGFDLMEPQREMLNNDIPQILTVGRFIEQKDHFTALAVVKGLADQGKTFKYVLVGWGHLETEIRQWVIDNELTEFVEIVVNPSNLHDYFRRSDIFFSTSLFEGVPNAVMEAMSFTLPVVATNAGDMKYLVLNGLNGYVTEVKDKENLTIHLTELLDSRQKRVDYGNNSYTRIRDEFGTEKFALEYENLIKRNLKV